MENIPQENESQPESQLDFDPTLMREFEAINKVLEANLGKDNSRSQERLREEILRQAHTVPIDFAELGRQFWAWKKKRKDIN